MNQMSTSVTPIITKLVSTHGASTQFMKPICAEVWRRNRTCRKGHVDKNVTDNKW